MGLPSGEIGVVPIGVPAGNAPPGAFQANQWVDVKGAIYPLGREVIVNASSISTVSRPDRPYLTP